MSIIEKNSQKRLKKELGAFYTPSYLALSIAETVINQYLIKRVNYTTSSEFISLKSILDSNDFPAIKKLYSILMNITILDGAAGDGEFLKACLTILTSINQEVIQKLSGNQKRSSEITLDILRSNLFGMEIDSQAVESCHKNLTSGISKDILTPALKHIKVNVVKGDFLESKLSDWKYITSSVKGFDIIISNPPWGGNLTKKQKDYYYEHFNLKCPKRNLNTFTLFVYQAAELLVPKIGVLAYLLPKNVTRSNQYAYLRKFIVTNFQILEIKFHGLFHNVTQEFVSLIGLYNSDIPIDHTIYVDDINQIPQSSYLTNIDYIFTRKYDTQSQQTIQLIQKNSIPLDHFVTIRRGEELSKRGRIMFCPTCEWVPLSSRKIQIICPQCKQPLSEQDLKINNLIQKVRSSSNTQPILTGDDFETFIINTTHFIDPTINFRSKKDPSIYKSPKIVVQKIKRFPCAAFDSEDYWTTQNVYNLTLKLSFKNNTDLLYYILSVLNSSLYRWFYESQFNLGSKYTNAISIHNLKRLPLRQPDFNNPLFNRIIQVTKNTIAERNLEKRIESVQKLDKMIIQYYNCEKIPIPNI